MKKHESSKLKIYSGMELQNHKTTAKQSRSLSWVKVRLTPSFGFPTAFWSCSCWSLLAASWKPMTRSPAPWTRGFFRNGTKPRWIPTLETDLDLQCHEPTKFIFVSCYIILYPSPSHGIHRPGTKALQQHKALFRFQTFSAFLLAPHVGLEEVAT